MRRGQKEGKRVLHRVERNDGRDRNEYWRQRLAEHRAQERAAREALIDALLRPPPVVVRGEVIG